MNTLKQRILDRIQPDLALIEEELTRNLEPHIPLVSHVAKYIMLSGGKRIRPVLMILSARICGYEGGYDKTLSVVFEYLHAATLLHDDVVDGAEVRRGKPVAHSIWGNPATVLVGDYLLARAISIASKTEQVTIIDTIASVTADMSEGEIHQLLHRGNLNLNEAEYMEVIRRKTACLIQGACRVGALLAGAPEDKVQALTRYGYDLGCAFQLADDLLDYTADDKILGKATGTDLKEGKMTLPLIYAMAEASDDDRHRLATIIRDGARNPEDFSTVLDLVRKHGGITYTEHRAGEHVGRARESLSVFESSETRSILEDLAHYVLKRQT
jgi:octaprenyl-diphosphate synthase